MAQEPASFTNEEAIRYLLKLEEPECPIPSNVIKDVDPRCDRPENLSRGSWYLVAKSREEVEIQNGCWKPSGPRYNVFTEPPLIGCRTDLQFFEGPDLQETIWMMHEFNITRDGSQTDVNIKDSCFLCRILKRADATKKPTEHGSTSGAVHVEEVDYKDYLRRGDYLELNDLPPAEDYDDYIELADLIDEGSTSSRSENSSCMTKSSGECFDSLPLLQDNDSNQGNIPDGAEVKDNNCDLSISALKEVLMNNGEEIHETADRNGKSPNHVSADENCSTAMGAASGRDTEGSMGGGKRMKKLRRMLKKKYLCFMPFFL